MGVLAALAYASARVPATLGGDNGPPPAPPVPAGADVEVHFVDVGQGDATLLRSPTATVLVDTGTHTASDVVAYLRAQDVTAVDVVAVTHPHADHLGQFDEVLDAFDVAEVWWSPATHTTATFERAVEALEASDAAFEQPQAGDRTEVGGMVFDFVGPGPGADDDDLHDSVLAFRVTWGQVGVLFTGDAEADTEARMVRDHGDVLAADVYQVGHHGSSTSTTGELVDAVGPAVAVWSAGQANVYGHPHEEVLDRLQAAGADVYGTAEHGTVVVTVDGTELRVRTADEPS